MRWLGKKTKMSYEELLFTFVSFLLLTEYKTVVFFLHNYLCFCFSHKCTFATSAAMNLYTSFPRGLNPISEVIP